MSKQFSVNTSICSEYQRLLEGSQSALEIWNEHRAEFRQFRFTGKEAGEEIMRWQSKYARAYTELQNHERTCSLCQLASRMEARDPENRSGTLSNYEMYT